MARGINGTDIGSVVIEGRTYRLVIHPVNCYSQKHWHTEPHADGTPVVNDNGDLIGHHHHDASCVESPLNATLYPDWETTGRHAHNFGEPGSWDKCTGCGAEREAVPQVKNKATPRDSKLFEYFMPADEAHPEGWSWERWTKHDI